MLSGINLPFWALNVIFKLSPTQLLNSAAVVLAGTVIIEFEAVEGKITGDCLPNISAKTTPTW